MVEVAGRELNDRDFSSFGIVESNFDEFHVQMCNGENIVLSNT